MVSESQRQSVATTRGIRVYVASRYVPQRSSPARNAYFFAYVVKIEHLESAAFAGPVQLLNRHWVITDGHNYTEEVRGPGVVGQQPVIESGDSFAYSSFCPLSTPVGSMRGWYEMADSQGERFLAEVAPFTLAVPNSLN